MKETGKSALRRKKEKVFSQYFSGNGIDIGAGDDGLGNYQSYFPAITSITSWDWVDGDAQFMQGVPDNHYDFVHSSHCLEHLENPYLGLSNWVRICKPGGYIVITVPDEDLYEQGLWPSVYNNDHKSSFTIYKPFKQLPKSINLLEMVYEFCHVVSCERISLIRENYDEKLKGIDQTAMGEAECAIELILRKKYAPSIEEFLLKGQGSERAHNRQLAKMVYEEALKVYPYNFHLYHRYAMLLNDLGLYNEALASWELCVNRLPNSHEARLYHALHLISLGRIKEGFALRDILIPDQRRTPYPPPQNYPRWTGQDLRGRSIVIWTEFGYGDEIFFLRFAQLLKNHGAHTVSVVCQEALVNLFKNGCNFPVYSAAEYQHVPTHDYWVFPHSIPVYLPLTLNELPKEPYLSIDNFYSDHNLIDHCENIRVGICFAGSPNHENDALRSLPSAGYLEDIFSLSRVKFYSFQKGPREAELVELAKRKQNLVNLSPAIDDFFDSAKLIIQMDLVITVDTSIAHLAGALGIPVWILLPTITDWRWHLGQDRSPWYPTAELFRQKWQGEWSEVLHRVKTRLVEMIKD